MQACSPGYEQLVLLFSNPVDMDCKDNHEETQGVTSEIKHGDRLSFKESRNRSEEIVTLLAEQRANKLFEHSPMWNRSSTKRLQTFKQKNN